MSPNPASDAILMKLPTPLVGEWSLRLAVTEARVRPELVLTPGTTYKDLPISTTEKPEVELWGDYLLTHVTRGEQGYHYYFFGKPKSDAEAATPIREPLPGAQHYDWPTVLHAIVFGLDAAFPVTEARPGGRSVKVPRERARRIITQSAFALCKTLTYEYLSPTPFNIPTQVQPVPGEVEWIVNGQAERLTCLHPAMTLPSRGGNWNMTSIQGDAGSADMMPSATKHFPATPLEDWGPFPIRDTQSAPWENDFGLYYRTRTIIYPPTNADRMSL